MISQDEHARTLAFAETAMGQIRSLQQAATPRNFEIWFMYATGHNQELNQTINDTLKRAGRLTEADLSQIYDKHLSPIRLSDRIDEVGGKIIGEIEQVKLMISDAIGSSNDFSKSLAGAQHW
jgi:diguanylate cyclase